MAVTVKTIPSMNVPFTDSQGRISPIWHEFLRSFVAATVDGTISGDNSSGVVVAGNGLTSVGDITLNVGQGNGIAVNANDVAVNINSLASVQASLADEVMISVPSDNNTLRKTSVSSIAALVDVASEGLDSPNGTDNVIGGNGAGSNLSTSTGNTLIGKDAGKLITTSEYNTALGWKSLDALTTTGNPYGSVAIGASALGQATGIANTAVGYNAGLGTIGSNHNTMLGNSVLEFTNSSNTVAIGSLALNGSYGTLADQVVIGYQAGSHGIKNVHVGYQSGAGNDTTRRDEQSGLGYQALFGRTGDGNVGVGARAGKYLGAGSNNTFLGCDTGATATTGDNNTVIGYTADKSAATVSNEFTLGNSSIATLRCQQTSITALSDRRDKKDIEDLELGLDFINTLRPVKFTWNMRDGGRVGELEAGFIAQELLEASEKSGAKWVGLVSENNLNRLEASPGKLLPILVKAVQELSKLKLSS